VLAASGAASWLAVKANLVLSVVSSSGPWVVFAGRGEEHHSCHCIHQRHRLSHLCAGDLKIATMCSTGMDDYIDVSMAPWCHPLP